MDIEFHTVEDRERWRLEKVDFVTSVLKGVDIDVIRESILECTSDNEVELLVHSLLEDANGNEYLAGREETAGRVLDADNSNFRPRSPYESDSRPSLPECGHIQASKAPCHDPQADGVKTTGILSDLHREIKRHSGDEGAVGDDDEDVEAKVMAQVVSLSEIFHDADPDYLQERCWEIKGNPSRFLSVVQKLLRDSYPKKDAYFRRKKEKEFRKFLEGLSVQEYVDFIEDPEETELDSHEQECGICCNDVATSDMVACDARQDRHRYCCNCIKKFVEEEIGQGRTTFRCPEIECRGTIPEVDLKHLLEASVLEKVIQRRQQEEIASAAIEDLESCPFCDFKVIMPNRYDVVFLCQNPGCMKDSCRKCKELNHIPLSCKEVLAEKQKDVRTMLENQMAEAMIRECVNCGKRFIIEAGCNKMVCPCGTMMCYLCKKKITGYEHFTEQPQRDPHKCPLWTDSNALHDNEVRQAAAQAKGQLHPDVHLVYDPTKDL